MEKGSKSVIVVDGEAPESSSDEEIESFNIPISPAKEASEADTLSLASTSNQSISGEFASVYHKKLYQKNEDLWNHLTGLLTRTIATSSQNLIATDQLLLKSQITLQSVSKTAKIGQHHFLNVTSSLRDLLGANFLPPIQSPTSSDNRGHGP